MCVILQIIRYCSAKRKFTAVHDNSGSVASSDIVMKTYPYVGLVLMALLVMVIHSHGFFLGHKNGMHARIIATAAIYQKVRREERWEI